MTEESGGRQRRGERGGKERRGEGKRGKVVEERGEGKRGNVVEERERERKKKERLWRRENLSEKECGGRE